GSWEVRWRTRSASHQRSLRRYVTRTAMCVTMRPSPLANLARKRTGLSQRSLMLSKTESAASAKLQPKHSRRSIPKESRRWFGVEGGEVVFCVSQRHHLTTLRITCRSAPVLDTPLQSRERSGRNPAELPQTRSASIRSSAVYPGAYEEA